MKKVTPFKVRWIFLEKHEKTFKLGDILIVSHPDFSLSDRDLVSDIFDKLKIKLTEYEYFINYYESTITIHFGTLI